MLCIMVLDFCTERKNESSQSVMVFSLEAQLINFSVKNYSCSTMQPLINNNAKYLKIMSGTCLQCFMIVARQRQCFHHWEVSGREHHRSSFLLFLQADGGKKESGGWRARVIRLPCWDHFLFIEAHSWMRHYWEKFGLLSETRAQERRHESYMFLAHLFWGKSLV